MNNRVLRRFITYMAVLLVVTVGGYTVYQQFAAAPPGDYEVRKGDILLTDRKYDEAIEWFDRALQAQPNHRGALMGRAIAFLQSDRYTDAEAEFTYLIDFMKETLRPDDPTGRGVLAAAYANRGILYDRTGQYEKALADYIQSLRVDEGAVEGPGLVHKILYGNVKPSTVRDRAIYLHQQLQLPASERVLRVPEIDAEQRMYKP